MTELVMASSNQGKIKEIRALLPDLQLLSLRDIGFDQIIEEPFLTFRENAAAKAAAIYSFCGKNVMADDSGICVNALNGAPGVWSARFAGEGANDQQNLDKLLLELKDKQDKSAYYKAVICLVWNGDFHYFEGECHGTIINAPSGTGGFGYDPVFVPNGYDQTFGALPPDVKNRISHRGKAVRAMAAFIGRQN